MFHRRHLIVLLIACFLFGRIADLHAHGHIAFAHDHGSEILQHPHDKIIEKVHLANQLDDSIDFSDHHQSHGEVTVEIEHDVIVKNQNNDTSTNLFFLATFILVLVVFVRAYQSSLPRYRVKLRFPQSRYLMHPPFRAPPFIA